MTTFSDRAGTIILALVFVDELLAGVAAWIYGIHAGDRLLAAALVTMFVAAWWTFASPRAPLAGPIARPLVKAFVFGLATVALWAAGHPDWAIAFLVFSVVINAVATHPDVERVAANAATSGRR